MAESTGDRVPYSRLVSDSALVSVFATSGVAAFGFNAVPVALPDIGAAFALTESEIGLVMTAAGLAGIVVIPVASVCADIYGRRRVVIPALVVFALSGVATLAVTSFLELLVLRAIQGAAFAATLPLTPTLIGDLYTGIEGSAAQGMRSGMNGLASATAPLVAGVLTAFAWQYPFVLFLAAIPVAGYVYYAFPETVSPRDRHQSVAELRADLREYWASLWAVADRRLAILISGGFTLFFLKSGFRTFLPVFVVVEAGASVTIAGVLLSVYGGVRVIVSPLAGSIMSRLDRKPTMLLATGAAVIGFGSIPLTPNLVVMGLAAATFAFGEAVLNPVVTDAVAITAADERRAGTMSGLQILKQSAITIAPVLMGIAIGLSGYATTFLLAASLGVVFGLVIVFRFTAVR